LALQSNDGHKFSGAVPSAMFTPFTSASTVTFPLPTQSPVHAAIDASRFRDELDEQRRCVGDGVGVAEGVGVGPQPQHTGMPGPLNAQAA
jgi:hypothetical protein